MTPGSLPKRVQPYPFILHSEIPHMVFPIFLGIAFAIVGMIAVGYTKHHDHHKDK